MQIFIKQYVLYIILLSLEIANLRFFTALKEDNSRKRFVPIHETKKRLNGEERTKLLTVLISSVKPWKMIPLKNLSVFKGSQRKTKIAGWLFYEPFRMYADTSNTACNKYLWTPRFIPFQIACSYNLL